MSYPLNYVNHLLTPGNAKTMGFQLVGDVRQPLDDGILFLLKSGFKLGQPTVKTESPEFLGLYRPLKN